MNQQSAKLIKKNDYPQLSPVSPDIHTYINV